jgi:MtrB/PioB family decaheme-associated outer membrane protein
MRLSITLGVLALALLPAAASAQEQTPPPQESEPLATLPDNRIDFGVRGTRLTGDGARFERYRDMGDGLFLQGLRYNRELNGWFLGVEGDHVGRLDQRVIGSVVKPGKLKISAVWDQIPMLLSRTTETLFVRESSGVLRVPDVIQTQVQPQPALITSMVQQFSRPFDMKTRRHIAEGNVEYFASRDLTIRANVRNIDRKGDIPFGGSFGHGSFVETPMPIRYDMTDVDGHAEFTRGDALIRGGYALSWFRNDVTSLLFENPYRATDATNATSLGRFALPPSNSFISVNGLASYRLPRRTRVTAYVSTGSLKDAGDPIVPFTANTALPVVPLDRTTVNGEARTSGVNLNLTSRPVRQVNLNVRYKYFNYDNRTPHFEVGQRVSYDSSLSTVVPPFESEPFGVARHTFDADLKYSPAIAMTAGIGFSRIEEERSFRIFDSTTDDVVRVLFDSVASQWLTLRTKYEHAERRGTGIERGQAELIAINEQPGLRHFDVAERDRNRVTLIGTAMPLANVSVNLSVAAGRDDFLNSTFGLLDNKHRVYTIGADATPGEQVTFGLSYSYEDYRALSRSRQANPGVQFTDVTRNWSTDGHDRVHSLIGNAEVMRIADKVDLRVSYDFSRARALYLYGVGPITDRTLPEETEVVASTLPQPTQLPQALSTTHRGTFEAAYSLTSRLDIGVSYWRDQYRVSDFTLDAQANPTLDRGNALLLGYIYRPYTANTFWGRLVYHW